MNDSQISCFLSYSRSYRPVMVRVRHLLEVLEIVPIVFEDPDQRPPWEVVESEIEKADFAVVLFGPNFDKPDGRSEPAEWPFEEAIHAHARDKPIAMVVHRGTRIPHMLTAYQTFVQFDFQSDTEYANHVHQIIKHVLETRRRVEVVPGTAPYYYQSASFTFIVDREERLTQIVHHHIVVRQLWSTFAHVVDTLPDTSAAAKVVLLNANDVELTATAGTGGHDLELAWKKATPHAQEYTISVRPPILPGGHIGYRRRFAMENFFPLTIEDLRARSADPGFPAVFHHGGTLYYGVSFTPTAEMQSLNATLAFPGTFVLRTARAIALSGRSAVINPDETARINLPDALDTERSAELGDTFVRLTVKNPLPNHTYLLLYEPGQ